MRDLLRGLPVLAGQVPPFDADRVPDEPVTLFRNWFEAAIAAGVTEPHAMTLSTVDRGGRPSARVLILKDVDEIGWHFAVNAVSRKGSDLAAHPSAALTFYWPQQVRQVRVSCPAIADPPEVAAADFRARPAGSRAMALTRRQSQPLTDAAEIDEALDKAAIELEREPTLVPDEWLSYAVRPDQVEFWQGDPQRRHRRVRYERGSVDASWSRTLLWP